MAISRTSIYVAAGRAVGARESDSSARNPDYLAEKLLGDPSKLDVDHPAVRALSLGYDEAMNDVEVVSNVRMMTIRTRFIDDALERAIAGGATQVVILGAGFDSHAYRFRDLLSNVRVFEIDRPETQALKKQMVNDVLGGAPSNLTYVAVDFQHEDMRDVLARHGYDPAQRTFFILEGVTMYLPEDAARDTFRFVAAHPPGSVIVFDFVYRAMIDMIAGIDLANIPEAQRPFVQRFLNLIKDEPWVFGLPVGGEREFLREFSLDLREAFTIGGEESLKRYVTRADGTQVGAEAFAAAMARMRERARDSAQPAPGGEMTPERMRGAAAFDVLSAGRSRRRQRRITSGPAAARTDDDRVAPTKISLAPTRIEIAPTMITIAPDNEHGRTDPIEFAPTTITVAPTRIEFAPTAILVAPTRIEFAPTTITVAPTRIEIAPTTITRRTDACRNRTDHDHRRTDAYRDRTGQRTRSHRPAPSSHR